MSRDDQLVMQKVIAVMEQDAENIKGAADPFAKIKADFDSRVAGLKESAKAAGKELSHIFNFARIAFEGGNEMLILVTELTSDYYSANFISHYGSPAYFEHNKDLMFYERQKEILREIDDLNL
jgi:hypothetical protein